MSSDLSESCHTHKLNTTVYNHLFLASHSLSNVREFWMTRRHWLSMSAADTNSTSAFKWWANAKAADSGQEDPENSVNIRIFLGRGNLCPACCKRWTKREAQSHSWTSPTTFKSSTTGKVISPRNCLVAACCFGTGTWNCATCGARWRPAVATGVITSTWQHLDQLDVCTNHVYTCANMWNFIQPSVALGVGLEQTILSPQTCLIGQRWFSDSLQLEPIRMWMTIDKPEAVSHSWMCSPLVCRDVETCAHGIETAYALDFFYSEHRSSDMYLDTIMSSTVRLRV